MSGTPDPPTPPRAIQIQTTVPSRDDAAHIAGALVEGHLAACVQIVGPISSTYRWAGEIETADEWLVLIKSTLAAYPAIEAAVRDLHAYDEPEIVALPIVDGSPGYLDWIAGSVVAPGSDADVEADP